MLGQVKRANRGGTTNPHALSVFVTIEEVMTRTGNLGVKGCETRPSATSLHKVSRHCTMSPYKMGCNRSNKAVVGSAVI